MLCCGSTAALVVVQPRRPKPFCQTLYPLRPMTTDAPGYAPAVMPRRTTRSTVARRSADMPTARGGLDGSPFPRVRTTVRDTSGIITAGGYGMRGAELRCGV